MDKLRRFDVFSKTQDDFRVRTTGGAIVSILSVTLIVLLFVSEVMFYLATDVNNELYVDTARGQKIRINLDMVFPAIGCAYLSLDAMDVSGQTQIDVSHDVYKKRLDKNGNPISTAVQEKKLGGPQIDSPKNGTEECGSCYGAEEKEGDCCNTCDEVRAAYRSKGWSLSNIEDISQCQREGLVRSMTEQAGEGCQLFGFLTVNRVAGSFHVSPGKSMQQHGMHIHDLLPMRSMEFNMTHEIRRLSFGEDVPGLVNPLDGAVYVQEEGQPTAMHQLFVKVVPTVYEFVNGDKVDTNSYAVTEHVRPVEHGNGLPGLFVMYDISPVVLKRTEERRSLTHFLTGVCAIVGGVFAFSGMIDGCVYSASKQFKGKAY